MKNNIDLTSIRLYDNVIPGISSLPDNFHAFLLLKLQNLDLKEMQQCFLNLMISLRAM